MTGMDVIISGSQIRFIYSDDLLGLVQQGETTVKRASHVEPAAGGGWHADMSPVNGPVLGPYEKRSDALRDEVKWLQANGVPQPKGE